MSSRLSAIVTAYSLALAIALAPTLAAAQTAVIATPLPNAKQTFVDSNGKPYSGGKVYSYVPNTTTAKTTWSDTSETTPNSNPVTLDSAGRATIFGQGNYRQVLKDSAGNTIWDSFTTAVGSSQPSGSNGTDTAPVGTVMPFAGLSVPTNWALAYGQTLSRALYPDLLTALTITNSGTSCTSSSTTISGLADTSQIRIGAPIEASCLPTGTTVATIISSTSITVNNAATSTGTVTSTIFPWGNGDGSLTFNVPDLRGRIVAGPDAQGGTAASRLTSTYFGASAAAPGVGGGSQSQTLLTANLPPYTPAGTVATTSPSMPGAADGNPLGISAGSPYAIGWRNTAGSPAPTFTSTFTGTPQGGTSTAFATIQPTLTMSYIIKVASNTSGAGGVVSLGGMFGDLLCGSGISCAAQTVSNSGVLSLGGLTGAISCTGGITCSAGSISITGFPTGVISFNGRTGAVVPAASDYAFSQLSGTASAAQLAAGAAATNVGALGGDTSGTLPNPTVVGLRGVALSSTAATNGQSYIYNSTSARWNPTSTTIYLSQYVPTPSSNDTTAVQAAFTACNTAGGCALVCPTGATYTVDTITVYSGTRLSGACTFQLRTFSNSILTSTFTSNISISGVTFKAISGINSTVPLINFTTVTNLWIEDCYFLGSLISDTGLASSPSGASPIYVTTSTHVWISRNTMYRFAYVCSWSYGNSDYHFDGNNCKSTAFGAFFRGNNMFTVSRNIFDTTAMYTTTPIAAQFAIAIGIDSTDGHTYGQNNDGTISGNVVKRYPYAQGILLHGGNRIAITGNVINGSSECISDNPFNATDLSDGVQIVGNTCTGTTAASLPAGSDVGIIVESGALTGAITRTVIANNTLSGFNRLDNDVNLGCIVVGYLTDVVITGNSINGCGQNGIVLQSSVKAAVVNSNVVDSIIGGGIIGILSNDIANVGIISSNMLYTLTTGVKMAGASANMKYTGLQQCVTVTTCTTP